MRLIVALLLVAVAHGQPINPPGGGTNTCTTGSGCTLANGSTATTQSALDSSTKVATNSYVDAAVAVANAGVALSYTTDHTLNSGDCGNWLVVNGTATTLTLANPPISATCKFGVININASAHTVSRNSTTINGVASNITIPGISGVSASEQQCWTAPDGANYVCSFGLAGAAGSNGTNGSDGGTGITVYSGLAGVSLSNATIFFPIGGGGLASATEASVSSHVQSSIAVTDFGVDLSASLGTTIAANNVVVVTWRKNGSDTAVTCTITNPATACSDVTHNFSAVATDVLDIKAVFTGTISATPNWTMNVQMGTSVGGATYSPPYISFGGASYGPVFALTAPALTGWTAENSASLTTSGGYLYISAAATSAVTLRGIYRTAPSAPYIVTYFIDDDIGGITTAGGELGVGAGWRQSSTGKIINFLALFSGSSPQIAMDYWNTTTSNNSTAASVTGTSIMAAVVRRGYFIRIQDDNTNLTIFTSMDGINFDQVFQKGRTAFMSGGPDQLWLGMYPNSGAARLYVYSMVIQ